MSSPISRRQFLKMLALLAGTFVWSNCAWNGIVPTTVYSGKLLGPSKRHGHALRDHQVKTASKPEIRHTNVVIVGGGIAGLSAAWWLQKQGVQDFVLLEMESSVGGNARSGKNTISAYPWGAHYVPLPDEHTVLIRQLFEELGVIEGYDADKRPIYNELYLCHEPGERLFKDGRWQEGLVPKRGVSMEEEKEFKRFFRQMQTFKTTIGKDGKKAFAIPLDFSSTDPYYRQLDHISMQTWLIQQKYHSRSLQWYVDYCCRDDYGALAKDVSAWAGIHYFAARNAIAANAEPHTVLTWPEGNGWLVEELRAKLVSHIKTQAMVTRIEPTANSVIIDYQNMVKKKQIQVNAKTAIFAAPRFVAKHVVSSFQEEPPAYFQTLQYAPWLVANISMKRLPDGKGAELAWDNVSYYSPSLGYVVATHQDIELFPTKTVLTYYRPLTHLPPKQARQEADKFTHQDWAKLIVDDLKTMHPGIDRDIEALDTWVWGHGMIRPSVGFIWGEARKQMQESLGHLHFSHSDMSGISIFEEAQYQGVEAAKKVLASLGKM